MMVDHRGHFLMIPVMNRSMHQNIQTLPLSGTDRNDRNTQHFRQSVQVYLHTAFFHNIHHIQDVYKRQLTASPSRLLEEAMYSKIFWFSSLLSP